MSNLNLLCCNQNRLPLIEGSAEADQTLHTNVPHQYCHEWGREWSNQELAFTVGPGRPAANSQRLLTSVVWGWAPPLGFSLFFFSVLDPYSKGMVLGQHREPWDRGPGS